MLRVGLVIIFIGGVSLHSILRVSLHNVIYGVLKLFLNCNGHLLLYTFCHDLASNFI